MTLNLSQYRYMCEPGSVNGGALSYWTVTRTLAPGIEEVRDNTTNTTYRAEITGQKVELYTRTGRKIKIVEEQGDLMNPDKIKLGNMNRDQTNLF